MFKKKKLPARAFLSKSHITNSSNSLFFLKTSERLLHQWKPPSVLPFFLCCTDLTTFSWNEKDKATMGPERQDVTELSARTLHSHQGNQGRIKVRRYPESVSSSSKGQWWRYCSLWFCHLSFFKNTRKKNTTLNSKATHWTNWNVLTACRRTWKAARWLKLGHVGVFQKDIDPTHKELVSDWINQANVELLEWTTQSPNLNWKSVDPNWKPGLWRKPTSLDELHQLDQEEWSVWWSWLIWVHEPTHAHKMIR